METAITIRTPPGAKSLPPNNLWQNRFEIHSETSNRVYIVAQNKASGKWSCSCAGWISHRTCKHLKLGCCLTDSQIHGRDRITEQKRGRAGY